MSNLTTNEDQFLLNGEPFRILAGAMHYFRVHHEQWEDRLRKLKAMGLNTVETYVAWNLHEPKPGHFDFSGGLDLIAFIKLAQQHDLYVIVRPGPYICAEWEFGGLPAWLLSDPNMAVRCSYPPYLEAVARFFEKLLPMLYPLQHELGGPIIGMQVENEYGSYGSDHAYLHWLENRFLQHRFECLLFTSDGATDFMLTHGTLPHILKTANFGSRANEEFATLRTFQPSGPLMCMEFWNGWFDHWGEQHHAREATHAAETLDEILAQGGSVNIFMFHGGTSFGFMNGANTDLENGTYQPTVNSYDYDAPLSEDGVPTEKYFAFRDVLTRYTVAPPPELPPPSPRLKQATVSAQRGCGLFEMLDRLSVPVRSPVPRSMEAIGQSYGFLLYRCTIKHPAGRTTLTVEKVHDRAQVFVNQCFVGVLERDHAHTLELNLPGGEVCIDLLVENLGRVNYGPAVHDRKGILGWVRLGSHNVLHGWNMYPLALENLDVLNFSEDSRFALQGPHFYESKFTLDQTGDGFLAIEGGEKGFVWINGFNLGRYWSRGPQSELYLPAPLLRLGSNTLTILELQASTAPWAQLTPDRRANN